MRKKAQFTIRQVIDLTGVSEFTIRGWENRYQAVTPKRTEKGRRLYSTDDILKIKVLKDLVDSGHQISTIANLSLSKLQALVYETVLPAMSKTNDPEMRLIFGLVDKYEWDTLKERVRNKRNNLDNNEFIFSFILPLLQEINAMVEASKLSIAQEHILSAIIKEELFSLRNSRLNVKDSSRIIFTTPEGELHEMGILLCSTLTSLAGKSNLYLGPNTPVQQIVDVCLRYQTTHLVLSLTFFYDKERLLKIIHFIHKQLPKEVTLCLGGMGMRGLQIKLNRPVEIFHSIEDFNTFLKKI